MAKQSDHLYIFCVLTLLQKLNPAADLTISDHLG